MQDSRAFIEDYDKIVCFISDLEDADENAFSVWSDGARIPIARIHRNPFDAQEFALELEGRLDPESPCFVICRGKQVIAAEPFGIYDKREFAEKYIYDGVLGATVLGNTTVFRVWSPFAVAVTLNLYLTGDGVNDNLLGSRMQRMDRGVWELVINDNLAGMYYTFTVVHNGRAAIETADPYGMSGGINGRRSMVVDFSSPAVTPEGWADEHRAYLEKYAVKSYTDAIVWEVHVRDFSGKTNAAGRDGFLAFTERGLTNAAGEIIGLDYLADLGVTHVHLLPVAEYATVDQYKLSDPFYNAFNWGYDPKNYNSPMGAYSSRPEDGNSRVLELRKAIAALHSRGIGVVLDVVYNHTYNFEAPIARIAPNYYYRFDYRGNPTNGSGCGNETASERPMCRKFIIDSLLAWAKNYHVDGFRFDLMGLHDVLTMSEIERAVHSVLPSALIYGEGWVGGPTSLPGDKQCNKWNVCGVQRSAGAAGPIAVFSDVMRDSVKGAVFRADEGGYVNGRPLDNVNRVKFSSMGATSPNFDTGWVVPDARNVVNYVSAHDNNTLWDKLKLTAPFTPRDMRLRMNRLAAGIVLTSRGMPFFQAGEEMLRSKPSGDGGFVENSYNSPDKINNIDWDKLTPGSDVAAMRDYYKGLIAFRKAHPVLRLCGQAEIEEATKFRSCPRYDMIAYTLTGCGEELFIVYNPEGEADVRLPEGEWSLRVSDTRAGDVELARYRGSVRVPHKCVYALVRIDNAAPAETVPAAAEATPAAQTAPADAAPADAAPAEQKSDASDAST